MFQAEDGIRDVAVTGVQTCALPIWREYAYVRRAEKIVCRVEKPEQKTKKSKKQRKNDQKKNDETKTKKQTKKSGRSEERRVGKECRTRWAPEH